MRTHGRFTGCRSESLEPRLLLSTVSGTKFHDVDNDGAPDGGEPRLVGWRIFQDMNSDDLWASPEPSTFAVHIGNYPLNLCPSLFGPLSARNREVLRTGWRQTFPVT